MLNIHLIYKPPRSWRILFWCGVRPRHLVHLNISRELVVPGRGCHKGIIIHGVLTPAGVLPNGHSFFRRKEDVKGAAAPHPNRRIFRLNRRSYGISTRPHSLNILIRSSLGMDDVPRDMLHGPFTITIY